MNKVIVILYLVAIFCFSFSIIKTKDVLKNVTTDIDSTVYLDIGHKEYTKESILGYYKQVLRYVVYFIYFIDVEDLKGVTKWKE